MNAKKKIRRLLLRLATVAAVAYTILFLLPEAVIGPIDAMFEGATGTKYVDAWTPGLVA